MNQQDEIDESVAVYDSENKVLYSNSPNNDIYNQFIIGIKFWQAIALRLSGVSTYIARSNFQIPYR
jgi:hypothetical protein